MRETVGVFRPKETYRGTPSLLRIFPAGELPETGEIRGIMPREYGVTTSESDYPFLGTFDLLTCVVVTVYDPQRKHAALAHLDSRTTVHSLESMLNDMEISKSKWRNLEIRLFGGKMLAKKMTSKIASYIESKGLSIASAHTGWRHSPSSLVIDSSTGNIYFDVRRSYMYLGMNPYNRTNIYDTQPLQREYNGISQAA